MLKNLLTTYDCKSVGTPSGGLTVRNAWRWTYCTERLAVDRARPAKVRAPFSIRSS